MKNILTKFKSTGLLKVAIGFLVGTLIASIVWLSLGHFGKDKGQSIALYSYAGTVVTSNDLSQANMQRYFNLKKDYVEQLKGFVAELVVQKYLDEEASKGNINQLDVLKKVLDIDQPTESQLKALYDKFHDQIDEPYDSVKDQLSHYMIRQQVIDKGAALFAKVKEKEQVEVLIADPQAPQSLLNTEGFPTKGKDDAEITVVDFFDYRCPHCKIADQTLEDLQEEFPDQIRLVYIPFPLDPKPDSVSYKMAQGGFCAMEQDRYWDYNEEAFANQDSLSLSSPVQIAKKLDLDTKQYRHCLFDQLSKDQVEKSIKEAQRLGLSSTPTLFLNGRQISPTDLKEGLQEIIKQNLNKKKS